MGPCGQIGKVSEFKIRISAGSSPATATNKRNNRYGESNMTKLCIVRGIPGSGKSTFAKKLLEQGKVQQHLEADEFMTDENGDYKFDPTILQKCHQQCQAWVKYYLDRGQSVVVSNTFSRKWEILPYTRMGAEFEVIEMKGNYQNVHGVPQFIIDNMKNRWQEWL